MGVQVYNFETPLGPERARSIIEEMGVQLTFAPLWWGDTEPTDGTFDWSALRWWDALSQKVPQLPQRIWSLYPVHMNKRGPLPADLVDEPFDSPRMLERFERFVVAVTDQGAWKDEGTIVIVGNEIDSWAKDHPNEVEAYLTFSDAAAAAIRRHAPNARVANTCTYDALDQVGEQLVQELNRSTDLVAWQWYDNGPDGSVQELSDLEAGFQRWEAVAGAKPTLVSEIGLPSATLAGSSEQMQAQRVEELFDVLSRRDRSRCEGAVWLGLNDWDPAILEPWTAGQFPQLASSKPFLAFLTSLGLRTLDDSPKPAYDAWVRRAATYR
jgi:hypothetical protein